jgi:tetratricopeptide (TPR) repeat protein
VAWAAHLGRRLRDLERADRRADAERCRRDADALLERLREKVAPERAELALALADEALGRLDEADRHFTEAHRLRPHDGAVLLRAAAFYVRLNRPAEAEPLLRAVFDPKAQVPDEYLGWPRRQLALILADQGDEGRRQAGELLDANRLAGGDPTADARARAFVGGVRAEERRAAIREIEATVTPSRPLAPDELFRLARLYEADDDWDAARERLEALLEPAGDPDNPEYLMYLVRGLRRHDEGGEAGPYVRRLKRFEAVYAPCRAVLENGPK